MNEKPNNSLTIIYRSNENQHNTTKDLRIMMMVILEMVKYYDAYMDNKGMC